MRAKPRPRDREREIFEAVLPLFLGRGGRRDWQEHFARAWAVYATCREEPARAVTPRLKALAEAIERLDRAAAALTPEAVGVLRTRLSPPEAALLFRGIRPRDAAPTPPREPDFGAAGRTLRSIATKARARMSTRRPEVYRVRMVVEVALSWQEGDGQWPSWSSGGPFDRHLRAVFDAGKQYPPSQKIIVRALAAPDREFIRV